MSSTAANEQSGHPEQRSANPNCSGGQGSLFRTFLVQVAACAVLGPTPAFTSEQQSEPNVSFLDDGTSSKTLADAHPTDNSDYTHPTGTYSDLQNGFSSFSPYPLEERPIDAIATGPMPIEDQVTGTLAQATTAVPANLGIRLNEQSWLHGRTAQVDESSHSPGARVIETQYVAFPTYDHQQSVPNPAQLWFDATLDQFSQLSGLLPEQFQLYDQISSVLGNATELGPLDYLGIAIFGNASAHGDETLATGYIDGVAVSQNGITLAVGTGQFQALANSEAGSTVSADAAIDAEFTDADVVVVHYFDHEGIRNDGTDFDLAYIHFLAVDIAGYTPHNGPVILESRVSIGSPLEGPDISEANVAYGIANGLVFGTNTMAETETSTTAYQDRYSAVSAQLLFAVG